MQRNADRRQRGAFRLAVFRPWRLAVAALAVALMLVAPLAPSLAKRSADNLRHKQPAAHVAKQKAKNAQHARKRTHRKSAHRKRGKAKPAVASARRAEPTHAAILIDAETGAVLSASNADARAYPASLAKMMTLYITFEELNDSRLTLDRQLPVSANAAAQEPSKLWLKPGESVRVRDLILALVTRSANDAAVVLAEAIGGSEAEFAQRMTKTARRLGMASTVFRNASGLPDPEQHTTARDMARLALALYQNFPREYAFFATEEFEFRGESIKGHNRLLESYDGVDGLKTGFIRASGFHLAASAERDGERLIGVILGRPSWRQRDKEMAALLDRGFAKLGSAEPVVAAADKVLPTPEAEQRAARIAKAGARLAAVFSTAAEAAPLPRRKPRGTDDDADSAISPGESRAAVQIGAFRAKSAARKLADSAADFPLAKGKIVHIVKPGDGARQGLYRVQLRGFTKEGASAACTRLKKKKKMPCLVVDLPRQARPS